jgi:hypothetical protein
MVLFGEMTSEMLSESGGCPDMILERNLRNTAIEFLKRTELWQDRRTINTLNGIGAYPLTVSDDESIYKLTYCSVNGRELLQSVPHRDFPAYGLPAWYFLRDDSLNLRPFDQLKGAIEVEVILIPNFMSVGVPDVIASRHAEALQKGALARTLLMPTTPWYDPKAAGVYQAMYDQFTAEARQEGIRSTHSRIRTTRFSW